MSISLVDLLRGGGGSGCGGGGGGVSVGVGVGVGAGDDDWEDRILNERTDRKTYTSDDERVFMASSSSADDGGGGSEETRAFVRKLKERQKQRRTEMERRKKKNKKTDPTKTPPHVVKKVHDDHKEVDDNDNDDDEEETVGSPSPAAAAVAAPAAKPDWRSRDVAKEYAELMAVRRDLINKYKGVGVEETNGGNDDDEEAAAAAAAAAAESRRNIYGQALVACERSVRELVVQSRMANTRGYYDLINGEGEQYESNNLCELEYFKRKMSHAAQRRVMAEMEAVNKVIICEKPHRIRLLESAIPTKYKVTVMQKLNTLEAMEPGDPEYYKLKNWMDLFMRIPFGRTNTLQVSMAASSPEECSAFMYSAADRLNSCVFGLSDAKMQIMQLIGQWIANPAAVGTAIAIKGPMGTGKSTLVKDGISAILGREFAFIALGGAGDSSFLEGHSYTYEGSTCGKIVQILLDAKSMNPVIYFDELDKVSESVRGDEIVGVLTHLTDTTQNSQFHDKYFSEIDFDLSQCLFIFSYNDESKINPILRDRMYVIQTQGYKVDEKLVIARNYLLPAICRQIRL